MTSGGNPQTTDETAVEAVTDTGWVRPPRWFAVMNLVFPLALAACGVYGYIQWVSVGFTFSDSISWLGMALGGLGWAGTHAYSYLYFPERPAPAGAPDDAPAGSSED